MYAVSLAQQMKACVPSQLFMQSYFQGSCPFICGAEFNPHGTTTTSIERKYFTHKLGIKSLTSTFSHVHSFVWSKRSVGKTLEECNFAPLFWWSRPGSRF